MLVAGPNLTIDRTMAIDELRPGEVLRFDAVAVTPGGKGVNVARVARDLGAQAVLVGFVPGRDKPALVLRVDVANVYGDKPAAPAFSHVIDDAIGHAVRLDAACVCVNLFEIPGEDALRLGCIENITRLRTAADAAGMPVMVEPLVMARQAGGYGVDGDTERIVALVRQAAELGADVIKADPTDDLSAYHRVVTTAGATPVLVRGGGRVSDEEILQRTRTVLDQGARGIVYGRNVIQHPDPAGMVSALRALVHGDQTT